jgi:hypothetical protein
MSGLAININGFAPVNRDLTVELRDTTGNIVKQVTPFADGTAKIPQLDPGIYDMVIRHPNLTLPVFRRPIRVLPDLPTTISVLIDPSQFRNTPIDDIPDANLTPVRQAAESVSETLTGISSKHPGESIRSDDWNLLAVNTGQLGDTLAQLTQLVSPIGHNHPELEAKINELSGNFDNLVGQLSAAIAELQRQIQALRFRKQIDDVFDAVPAESAAAVAPAKAQALALVANLETAVTDTPTSFARTSRNVGAQFDAVIDQVLTTVPTDDTVKAATDNLAQSTGLMKNQRSTNYGDEITLNRKMDRVSGGAGLLAVLKQQ